MAQLSIYSIQSSYTLHMRVDVCGRYILFSYKYDRGDRVQYSLTSSPPQYYGQSRRAAS